MGAQHFGKPLHGLDSGAHGSGVPVCEKELCPEPGTELPEELEIFAHQVSADGIEIGLENVGETGDLVLVEVGPVFQEDPTAVEQNVVLSGAFDCFDFIASDLIDGFVELPHDVEAIEDVKGLGSLFADHAQVGFPHVGADEFKFAAAFFAELVKEAQQRFDGAVRA